MRLTEECSRKDAKTQSLIFIFNPTPMYKKPNRYYLPIVILIFIHAMITGCVSSKNVAAEHLYFQQGNDTVSTQQKETIIQPNDLLSIQVFSKTVHQFISDWIVKI